MPERLDHGLSPLRLSESVGGREGGLQGADIKFRCLYENSPFGIVICELIFDDQGNPIDFIHREGNPAAGAHTGFPLEQIIGKRASDLLSPADTAHFVQQYAKVVTTGKPLSYTQYFPIYDRFLDVRVFRLDENLFFLNFHDITAQKKAEAELRLKNTVFASSLAANSIADAEGKLTYVNRSFLQIWGYDEPEEVIGLSISSFFADGKDAEPILAALNHSGQWQGTFTARKKDGSTFVSLGLATVVQDGQGECLGYQSSNLDVTAQMRASEALQVERNLAQSYLDIAGVIFVALDRHQCISMINRKGCETLGVTEDEALGRNWFDLFIPEAIRAQVKETYTKLIAGDLEPVEYYENAIVTKQGEERIVAWHNSLVYDEKGTITGTLSSGEDITARKQSEKQIEAYRLQLEDVVRDRTWQLNQRLKELNCIFAMSELVETPDISLEGIIQGTVEILPSQWQQIQDTHVRIRLEGTEYLTDAFREANHRWSRDIIVHGSPRGSLDIFYDADGEGGEEVKFLPEEQRLLDAVTERLGRIVERKRAEALMDLAKFPSENPHPVLRVTQAGDILYSNEAGQQLLNKWESDIGDRVPDSWCEFIHQAFEHEKDLLSNVEEKVAERVYSFTIAPIKEAGYANLYGLDVTERIQALAEITQLAKFPAENPNPVMRVSVEGVILYANPASAKVLASWECEQGQVLPPEQCRIVAEVVESGQICDQEVVCDQQAIALTYTPVPEAGFVNIYGLDVTERKQALTEITQLAKFPAENPNPVIRVSLAGNVLYANPASAKVLASWECEQGQVLPSEQRYIVAQVAKSGQICGQEVVCGNQILALTYAPVPEAGFVNIYGLDVTERVQVGEALRESEQRYAQQLTELNHVYNTSPVGLCFMDTDLRFIRINEALAEVNGKSAEKHIGKTLGEILPDLVADLEPLYRRVITTGEPILNLEIHAATPGRPGVGRDWLVSYYPVQADDGMIIGVGSVVQEITELKAAEERARRAQEKLVEQQRFEKQRIEEELERVRDELVRKTQLAAIGQVSGSIAHDLRNPLGSVRNAHYLLKRRLPNSDPRLTKPLRIIDEEVARADQIITNLLSIARRRVPEKTELDLGALLECVINQHEDVEAVAVQIDIEPMPFTLLGDDHLLQQVFTNLFSNACHAMPEGGIVRIVARWEERWAIIDFMDNGKGIPADVLDRIFEPLVTTKTKGTGLGLTICRQIVEAHGGAISVQPRSEEGTCIRIKLPSAQTENDDLEGDIQHGLGSTKADD